MDEWRTLKWGDVVTLQRGYDITKAEQVLHGTVPVVSSGGIGSFHDEAKNEGPGVVIGRKGTLGKVHFIDGPFWPHDTTLWVKDFKGNVPRFVYYALQAIDPAYLNVGTASPTLNRNHFHPLDVVWPPSTIEQQAIAEVLGALDDKIAANARLATVIDNLLSAQLIRLSGTRGTTSLRGLASVNRRTTTPKSVGKLRYLDISSVGKGTYDFPPVSDWENAPSRARRLVARGDVVWSTVRPNRRAHALVLDDDDALVGSTGLAVLTPQPGRVASVYEAVRTDRFAAYLETVAEGSAYPAVRAERFLDAPIPDLESSVWDRFEEQALPMRELVHATAVESRRLAETRDELLPLLMSGKVRVKDAETAVGEAI